MQEIDQQAEVPPSGSALPWRIVMGLERRYGGGMTFPSVPQVWRLSGAGEVGDRSQPGLSTVADFTAPPAELLRWLEEARK